MLTWQKFTKQTIQFVLFRKAPELYESRHCVHVLLRKFSELFDGDLQVLPLSNDAPPEVPRVTIRSADERWMFQESMVFASCTWNRKSPTDDIIAAFSKASEIVASQTEEVFSRVTRMSLVAKSDLQQNIAHSADSLIRHFCTEKIANVALRRSSSFELHNHKIFTLLGKERSFEVNSWVRCVSGREKISVIQDINTVVAEDAEFSTKDLDSFYPSAFSELNTILALYFSEQ